jgi:hypothetical protein
LGRSRSSKISAHVPKRKPADLLREEVEGLRVEMKFLREESRESMQGLREELQQALRQELTARPERMESKLDERMTPRCDAAWRRQRSDNACP